LVDALGGEEGIENLCMLVYKDIVFTNLLDELESSIFVHKFSLLILSNISNQ
jgi:hypothetical protein